MSPESKVIEEDGMFTCRLCNERLDGNHESKQHLIKKHMKYDKQTMTGNTRDYVFCMDMELEKSSHFCKYYKNMLDL